MKQFVFSLHHMREVDEHIDSFQKDCPKQYSSILVSIFTHWNRPEKIHNLIQKIAERLPDASIVGSTSSGGIANGRLTIHKTVITFMVFQNTNLHILAFDNKKLSTSRAGNILMDFCQSLNDIVGIEFLSTFFNFDIHNFFKKLKDLRENIKVFGGVANTHDKDVSKYVFTKDEVIDIGLIAICFESTDLHLHVRSCIGWKPLGSRMKITSTDGSNIVKTLDDMPAIDVYKKYLNITPNKHFNQNVLEFPLLLYRDGRLIARLAEDWLEDGSLIFSADCYEGESIRLAYGDPEEILNETQNIQQNISDMRPEGILLFSCITRRLFLQNNVQHELHYFQEIAPTAGFYTYGEIERWAGKIHLLNMSMASVSFREGPALKPAKSLSFADRSKHEGDVMSLAQRLARFITVTSNELVEANKKLVIMAKHDGLTGLFNRGETENMLKDYILNEVFPLSAIMLDLDNFKSINDTFGHETGDLVLKSVAEVMTECVGKDGINGRWGGEEFLIALPHVNFAHTFNIAENIRLKIAAKEILPQGWNVTASIGIAEIRKGESYLEFYKRLDKNLYRAKTTGKNRVCPTWDCDNK